jgi:hypothetical protein
MLIIAYIYLRNVIRISQSVHAYKNQTTYNNSHHCTRHNNSYSHPFTTAHAIQEVLHYRNVFFERRSLLPVPWCKRHLLSKVSTDIQGPPTMFETTSKPYLAWQDYGKMVNAAKPKGLVVVSAHWEDEAGGSGVTGKLKINCR